MDDIINLLRQAALELTEHWPDPISNRPALLHFDDLCRDGKLPILQELNRLLKTTDYDLFHTQFRQAGLIVPAAFINPGAYLVLDSMLENQTRDLSFIDIGPIVQNFFESLKIRTCDYSHCILLNGFTSDLEEIDLPNGVKIRKIQADDEHNLRKRNLYQYFQKCDLQNNRYLAFYHTKNQSLEQQSSGDVRSVFQETVDCLKILSNGKIEYYYILSYPESYGAINIGQLVHQLGEIPTVFYSKGYRLASTDLAKLRAIITGKSELAGSPSKTKYRISNALSRIIRTNDRFSSPVDQFVDLVIALDAIFGDSGDSLRYKISMRAAYFLAESEKERHEVFNLIASAYGMRNKIVHGATFREDVVFENITKLHDHTRSIVVKLFQAGIHKEKMDGELFDKIILNGNAVGE